MLPQNTLFWHIDYFELMFLKKQSVQGLSVSLKEINLPCERYPLFTNRVESIPRDREFRAKKAI